MIDFKTVKIFKIRRSTETYEVYYVNAFVIPDDVKNINVIEHISKDYFLSDHFVIVRNKDKNTQEYDPHMNQTEKFQNCYNSYCIFKSHNNEYNCHEYSFDNCEFSDPSFRLLGRENIYHLKIN